jgi:hypothetical protein
MKKVGIVTFHRSHNCGSILQSFAMQEVLKQYALDSEFIDFATVGQLQLYSVFRPFKFDTFRKFAKSCYKNILGLALYSRAKNNWKSYDLYLTRYLKLSEHSYFSGEAPHEDSLPYDLYLTGSDQVWNVSIEDYDDAYFLNFVHNHPKIAYAVSQGAKDIAKYSPDPQKIASYIRDIDHVSTREENGQTWLKTLTGNDYPVVLDPTLLLEETNYEHIEETHGVPCIQKNNYIFVYAAPLSADFLKLIKKYGQKNNLQVVIWHDDIWLKRLGWLSGIKCPKNKTPGKYLDLIKNAKYVCTSSFHGVAFSTIYRKNFVVLENDGMLAGQDDRMTGFLKRLGLSDRIVSLSQFIEKMDLQIDYTDFKSKLRKQQELSHKFLSSALRSKSS